MLDARELDTLLWLPLSVGGATVGTLALAWRADPRLSAGDLEASSRFAELGARAILGSERVRTQAEVLRRVLSLLLSVPPPVINDWEIRVRYESASQLAQIGGDFYDVVEVGHDRLAFIVADTRGKGLEASSLAAVLKGGFRSLAGEGTGPSRILALLDRLVRREGGEEDFVTALVGTVDAGGEVVLATAGHPLPFGVALDLVEVGPPLGLGNGTGELRFRLAPGERLVCFTDGLIEARDPSGEFVDPAKLEQALAEEQLDAVLDRLVDVVNEHVQGRLGDDLALLGLEYAPRAASPAARRRELPA
jgi:sigma-B regulation protein RsbU (phosphoserine phosphatase)